MKGVCNMFEPRYYPAGPCVCGGLWVFLGSLGVLDWYRCQDCGLEMNTDGTADLTREETFEEVRSDHD